MKVIADVSSTQCFACINSKILFSFWRHR